MANWINGSSSTRVRSSPSNTLNCDRMSFGDDNNEPLRCRACNVIVMCFVHKKYTREMKRDTRMCPVDWWIYNTTIIIIIIISCFVIRHSRGRHVCAIKTINGLTTRKIIITIVIIERVAPSIQVLRWNTTNNMFFFLGAHTRSLPTILLRKRHPNEIAE